MIPDLTVIVREARPNDLAAVAAAFLACWRTSYAGFLPPDVIDMYDDDSARALWQRTLNDPPADAIVLVAEQIESDVLGVIRIGPDPDDPISGHVYSLYVRPDTQRLGVGTRLLAAADDRFRRDDLQAATLWVFAANAAALGFYSRLGWQPDGAQRVEPQYGEPELRLRRTLGGVAGDGGAASEGAVLQLPGDLLKCATIEARKARDPGEHVDGRDRRHRGDTTFRPTAGTRHPPGR